MTYGDTMRFTIHHFNLNNRTYNTFAIAKVEMYNDALEVCKALAEANGETMCVVDDQSVRAIYESGVGFSDPDNDDSLDMDCYCDACTGRIDDEPYDGVPEDTGSR
jgi:hypothetical protein